MSRKTKREVRSEVYARDGRICRVCGHRGSNSNRLTIHHIIPKRKRPDLVNDPRNCVVLCTICHRQVHQ